MSTHPGPYSNADEWLQRLEYAGCLFLLSMHGARMAIYLLVVLGSPDSISVTHAVGMQARTWRC